jgi:hypothetical protein
MLMDRAESRLNQLVRIRMGSELCGESVAALDGRSVVYAGMLLECEEGEIVVVGQFKASQLGDF